jgi:L-iditol 2-dehydrogenase
MSKMGDARMWATVFMAPGELSFRQMPMPEVGPEDLLVKINTALTCGTDVKTYKRGHPKYDPPTLFGHEFAGDVVAVGSAVKFFQVGMRVVAGNTAPCCQCYFCKRGQPNLCDDLLVNLGAFAEYIRIPGSLVRQNTFVLLDHVSYREAAIIEPLACSVHAVNLAQIQLADVVVVSGLGAIGMGILQVTRLKTPRALVGLDVDDGLLEIATRLGADSVLNPLRDDVPAELEDLTGGRGPDIYIEASGSVASLRTGLDVLRKAGRLVVYGVYSQDATVDFNLVSEFKELEIVGGHVNPNTYPLAIKYLTEGLIDWKAMVTHTYPLAQFKEAINAKKQSGASSIKTLLIP